MLFLQREFTLPLAPRVSLPGPIWACLHLSAHSWIFCQPIWAFLGIIGPVFFKAAAGHCRQREALAFLAKRSAATACRRREAAPRPQAARSAAPPAEALRAEGPTETRYDAAPGNMGQSLHNRSGSTGTRAQRGPNH